MGRTIINPYDFCTSMHINLKRPRLRKKFRKEKLIHPAFWPYLVTNLQDVVFKIANRIIATQICKISIGILIIDCWFLEILMTIVMEF